MTLLWVWAPWMLDVPTGEMGACLFLNGLFIGNCLEMTPHHAHGLHGGRVVVKVWLWRKSTGM